MDETQKPLKEIPTKLKHQQDIPIEQVYEMIYKVSKDLSNCGNCDMSKSILTVTPDGLVINYLICNKGIIIDPKKKCADWVNNLGGNK